jgi:type VI secretion system secreted protein VgrG
VKIDPSGVAMGGAAIKLNAGGSPGKGRGKRVQVPEMPGLVAREGVIDSAPEKLPEPPQRLMAKPDQIRAIKNAASQGKGICQVCLPKPQGTV